MAYARCSAPTTSPVAVVQGYSPDTDWAMLAEGAIAIRRGALWVASNLDATVPSPRGPLPGNGSLVAASAPRHRQGRRWRPASQIRRCIERRSSGPAPAAPLVVGDRLDTDIEGARGRRLSQPAGAHRRHDGR